MALTRMTTARTAAPLRLIHWLLFLLAFLPAIHNALLVKEKAVDVGTWDEWENALLMEKWREGTLTWRDLYAPQIQHRIVVPRLLIIAMTEFSGGDFRVEEWAVYAVFLINALLIWRLLQRTHGDSPWRWPLMLLFNTFIFSPMHYQMSLWGACLWAALPMCCLLGSIVLLCPVGEMKHAWWRLAGAILLMEVGTHSFAHGLALWPVLGLLVLVQPALGPWKRRFVMGAVVALIGAATIASYFTDFHNVAWHAYNLKPGDHALDTVKHYPLKESIPAATRFLLAFVGTWFARTPFEDHPLDTAILCGTLILPLVLLIFAATVFNRQRFARSLPWLTLVTYAMVVGLMVSKRATDIGEHRAVTPRYLAISQYLYIGSIALAGSLGVASQALVAKFRNGSSATETTGAASPRALTATAIVLFTAILCAQGPVWRYGLHLSEIWHRARLQSVAILYFLPFIQDQGRLISYDTLDKVTGGWSVLDAVQKLEKHRLLRTKPLPSPELRHFDIKDKPLDPDKAGVTSASLAPDGVLSLSGNARFSTSQPVDAVLLVQKGRVISLAPPTPPHLLRLYSLDYEMSNTLDVPVKDMFPFKGQARLNDTTSPIELWALDVKRHRVTPLPEKIEFDAATKQAVIKPR